MTCAGTTSGLSLWSTFEATTFESAIMLGAVVIGVYVLLWLLFVVLVTPDKRKREANKEATPSHSNCFLWALRQWWQHGGYLCFRPSRVWRGPHVLWLPAEGGKMQHFVPTENTNVAVGCRLHWLIWFRGEVKEGDQ
jgi:hypothetical protein